VSGSPPVYAVQDVPGEGRMYVPRPNLPDITRRFAADKPAVGFRIFAFGGSTTWGDPFGNAFAFPAAIERQLRRANPGRPIEVINMGVSGDGSSRVFERLREAVAPRAASGWSRCSRCSSLGRITESESKRYKPPFRLEVR